MACLHLTLPQPNTLLLHLKAATNASNALIRTIHLTKPNLQNVVLISIYKKSATLLYLSQAPQTTILRSTGNRPTLAMTYITMIIIPTKSLLLLQRTKSSRKTVMLPLSGSLGPTMVSSKSLLLLRRTRPDQRTMIFWRSASSCLAKSPSKTSLLSPGTEIVQKTIILL